MSETQMDKAEYSFHKAHCCVIHGCKYGEDEDCPVVNRQIEQCYPCPTCFEGGLYKIEAVRLADTFAELADFTERLIDRVAMYVSYSNDHHFDDLLKEWRGY